MIRFFGGATLALAALAAACWAALVEAPQAQSPKLAPPELATGNPTTRVQAMTAGEMHINADWFDLILRGARQDGEPAPPPKRNSGTVVLEKRTIRERARGSCGLDRNISEPTGDSPASHICRPCTISRDAVSPETVQRCLHFSPFPFRAEQQPLLFSSNLPP